MPMLPNVTRYRKVVDFWAEQTKTDPALIFAMIHMESGGNPNSLRYEANYKKKHRDTPKFKQILEATGYEPEDVATSYGLMQLMMPTAWGYMSSYQKNESAKTYLLTPSQNVRFGSAHVSVLMKRLKITPSIPLSIENVKRIAAEYNGSSVANNHAICVASLYQQYRKLYEKEV